MIDDQAAESTGPQSVGLSLWYNIRVLWLCGFAIFVLAAAAYLFIGNDQGADFLRIIAEHKNARVGFPQRLAFFIAVAFWSLATWYACRLLLIRRLPGFPLPSGPTARMRTWTPRILGGLAPLIICWGFLALALPGIDDLHRALTWWAVTYFALAVTLFVFFWKRRTVFGQLTKAVPAQAHLDELPRESRRIITVAIVCSFLLLLLFVAAPITPARILGAPAIFTTAGTSLMLFASIVLTLVPLARGYPSLLVPVLVWAAIVSLWNDNHGLRTTQAVSYQRQLPADHLKAWLAQALRATPQPDAGKNEPGYPIFFVVAAGGGIRAAYWPAVILGTIADKVHPDVWQRHFFAASGVSGGSLGTTVHLIELAAPVAGRKYVDQARKMLQQDFVSPLAAFMLYPDLLQRFLPVPIPAFDRARALEMSWEYQGRRTLKNDALADSFLALWANRDPSAPFPSLLLNSTRAETGQRVILSNLDLAHSPSFLDTVDPLALQGPDARHSKDYSLEDFPAIPLSTAVHLSARFTFVSPAATVDDQDGKLWGRLVDGGYFENSGAATAAELISAVCKQPVPGGEWQCGSNKSGVRVFPVVLLIKNDPEAPSACTSSAVAKQAPSRFVSEVRAPIDALLATREARGRLAERQIVQLLHTDDAGYAHSCGNGCVLEFSLAHEPSKGTDQKTRAETARIKYVDPPLGWSLSEASQAAIKARLGAPDIKDRISCVVSLIATGRCDPAPSCGG